MMLKTKVERLDGNMLRLDIEVPPEDVKEATDHTLRHLASDLHLPGFRPGKVPPQAVLAKLGREAVTAEVVRHHIDHWYGAAVASSGIRPVGSPDVDFPESTEEDGSMKFSVTVEVVAKPKLPDLAGLEVPRPEPPELEKFVKQVLDATLTGAGELTETGEEAVEGNEVLVDFRCEIDGKPVEGAAAVGYQARLGDGRLLQEIEQAIIGSKAGSELKVDVEFGDDHPMSNLAGQTAVFHVTLREVMDLKLPELTDEVAAKVSEYSTAAELRKDIEDMVRARFVHEIDGIFRGNAVAKLAEASEVELPPQMVQNRQQELYRGFRDQLAQSGLAIEAYLNQVEKSMEDLMKELEEGASDDIKRELCLLALAEDASISVHEDDFREEVTRMALEVGDDPEEAFKRISDSGRMEVLAGELLMQRTIDHLIASVKAVPQKVEKTEEDSE